MKPFGFIYLTTNNVNGKIYIGQHEFVKSARVNATYIGSGGKHFKHAVEKYGRENFSRKILKVCYSIEEMNEMEEYYIKKYDATNPDVGYNLLPGAPYLLNPSKLESVKKAKSERFSGEGNPMYGKRGEDNPNFGKKRTCKKTQGENHWNYGKPSPFRGKHLSDEARKILSEKTKARLSKYNPSKGRKVSDEQKKAQSEKMKAYYDWLYS